LQSLVTVDDLVEDVVAALDEAGRLDRSFIFFASDNGYHYGEHRIRSGKGTPFEESVRVPFVVRGPGVPRGVSEKRLVANIDLLPTVLDLVGRPLPAAVDGRSLVPLLVPGPTSDELEWRKAVLLESRHELRNDDVPMFSALRTDRWKWIEYANGERELYDLEGDPFELDSVAGVADNAPLERALSARLREFVECSGEGCRSVEAAAIAP
jgi:arylsulfatase A-like enzyme